MTIKRELNKPRLRVHRYGGDAREWHFIVSEWVKDDHQVVSRPLAWGEATHRDDAMAAGRSALQRALSERAPAVPKEEPKKEPTGMERPLLTAGSHLVSSERRWSFGFASAPEVWT